MGELSRSTGECRLAGASRPPRIMCQRRGDKRNCHLVSTLYEVGIARRPRRLQDVAVASSAVTGN